MAPPTGTAQGREVDRQHRDSHNNPLRRFPMVIRNDIISFISEFSGTFLFLFMALGATNVVNSAPSSEQPADTNANPAKLLYISLAFGLSLVVNVWAFYRSGGGLFNPAVALALFLTGEVHIRRTAIVIVAQLLGAIAGAAVVKGLAQGPLLATTDLVPGMSATRGLFLEMFLTAQLIFAIFMLAVEKNRATYIAPVGIGLALFVSEMMGVYYTGGSLNPARSFGPCVVNQSFPHYHWIYWVGPILGALLASGLWGLLRAFEYWTVVPEIDRDPAEGGYWSVDWNPPA